MEWTIEFVEEKNYIRVDLTGDFNASDHLRMIEDILSQTFWKRNMNVLFDSRKVDYSHADSNVMKIAGSNMSRFDSEIGQGKAAILMESVADFAKGREFEMETDEEVSANVRVFINEGQALKWIMAHYPFIHPSQ